jgi:hypothetical protein
VCQKCHSATINKNVILFSNDFLLLYVSEETLAKRLLRDLLRENNVIIQKVYSKAVQINTKRMDF